MSKAQFWGGRFEQGPSELMWEFSRGKKEDRALFLYDILASISHTKELNKAGILSDEEAKHLIAALEKLKSKFSTPDYEEEDIHSFVQEQLREMVGSLADKLHTARSRNDLVACDSIMFLIEKADVLISKIQGVQLALLEVAKKYKGLPFPSFTHLQDAQVVLFSHYLLGYIEAFERIKNYLDWFKSNQSCPLTSCAGAGTSIPISALDIAKGLGFDKVYTNSLDAISNRDYYLDFSFATSKIALLCSRICEDWIIYSSAEFGFVSLPDEFSTGSSIMPHKKNPDSLELIRAKSSKIISGLFSLFTLMKALPSSYNRDMQEDKEILFPIIRELEIILDVLKMVISGIKVNEGNIHRALDNDFLYATDIMEFLIKKGTPSREAHHKVGELVKLSEEKNIRLKLIDIEDVNRILNLDLSPEEYDGLFDPMASVNSKTSYSGTCLENVEKNISLWEFRLNSE